MHNDLKSLNQNFDKNFEEVKKDLTTLEDTVAKQNRRIRDIEKKITNSFFFIYH